MRKRLTEGRVSILVIGCIAGLCAGAIVLLFCHWMASMPAATDQSMTHAFRPWCRWSNRRIAIAAAVIVCSFVVVLGALRRAAGARIEKHEEG